MQDKRYRNIRSSWSDRLTEDYRSIPIKLFEIDPEKRVLTDRSSQALRDVCGEDILLDETKINILVSYPGSIFGTEFRAGTAIRAGHSSRDASALEVLGTSLSLRLPTGKVAYRLLNGTLFPEVSLLRLTSGNSKWALLNSFVHAHPRGLDELLAREDMLVLLSSRAIDLWLIHFYVSCSLNTTLKFIPAEILRPWNTDTKVVGERYSSTYVSPLWGAAQLSSALEVIISYPPELGKEGTDLVMMEMGLGSTESLNLIKLVVNEELLIDLLEASKSRLQPGPLTGNIKVWEEYASLFGNFCPHNSYLSTHIAPRYVNHKSDNTMASRLERIRKALLHPIVIPDARYNSPNSIVGDSNSIWPLVGCFREIRNSGSLFELPEIGGTVGGAVSSICKNIMQLQLITMLYNVISDPLLIWNPRENKDTAVVPRRDRLLKAAVVWQTRHEPLRIGLVWGMFLSKYTPPSNKWGNPLYAALQERRISLLEGIGNCTLSCINKWRGDRKLYEECNKHLLVRWVGHTKANERGVRSLLSLEVSPIYKGRTAYYILQERSSLSLNLLARLLGVKNQLVDKEFEQMVVEIKGCILQARRNNHHEPEDPILMGEVEVQPIEHCGQVVQGVLLCLATLHVPLSNKLEWPTLLVSLVNYLEVICPDPTLLMELYGALLRLAMNREHPIAPSNALPWRSHSNLYNHVNEKKNYVPDGPWNKARERHLFLSSFVGVSTFRREAPLQPSGEVADLYQQLSTHHFLVPLLYPAIGKRIRGLDVPEELKLQQAELVELARSGRILVPSDIQSSGEAFLLWILENEEDCY